MVTTEKIDLATLNDAQLLRTLYLEKRIDIAKLALEGLEIRNELDKNILAQLVLVKATGRFFLYIRDKPLKDQGVPADGKETEIASNYYNKVDIQESNF